jgi:hypothetical protein
MYSQTRGPSLVVFAVRSQYYSVIVRVIDVIVVFIGGGPIIFRSHMYSQTRGPSLVVFAVRSQYYSVIARVIARVIDVIVVSIGGGPIARRCISHVSC